MASRALESLDIDLLRAFVVIVDSNSFSRAGDVIGRTQSAISLRLRHLEQSLGVALLVRGSGRRIELTDSGRTLLSYARRIISLSDAAILEIGRKPVGNRVRIGVTTDFFDADFPALLKSLEARFTNIQLVVETDVSLRLRHRCMGGDLDIVLYKSADPDGFGTSLMPVGLTWAMAPGFVPDLRAPLPLIAFPEGCAYRKAIQQTLQHAGIAYSIVVTTPSLTTLRAAVAAQIGITALPAGDAVPATPVSALKSLPAIRDVTLTLGVVPSDTPLLQNIADAFRVAVLARKRPALIRASRSARSAEEASTAAGAVSETFPADRSHPAPGGLTRASAGAGSIVTLRLRADSQASALEGAQSPPVH